MKERPILFSAPMVRALLDGRKTQTRRVVKPEGAVHIFQFRGTTAAAGADEPTGEWGWCGSERVVHKHIHCPYGQPGDRLWVREPWADVPRSEPLTDEDQPWREDGRILLYKADPEWEGARHFICADGVLRWAKPARWTPSIHMPRWASRITLDVTGVRVERLQDISIEDAKAEGAWGPNESIVGKVMEYFGIDVFAVNPINAYQMLWESINGPGSWDLNPWVWVVEFKRVAP